MKEKKEIGNRIYGLQFEKLILNPDEELKKRLASRGGKKIPWSVIESMRDNWEEPTEEEGFNEIWYAE